MNTGLLMGEISGYCEFIYSNYQKFHSKYSEKCEFEVFNPIARYRVKNAFQRLILNLNKLEFTSAHQNLIFPIGKSKGQPIYIGHIFSIALESSQLIKWANEAGWTKAKIEEYSKYKG